MNGDRRRSYHLPLILADPTSPLLAVHIAFPNGHYWFNRSVNSFLVRNRMNQRRFAPIANQATLWVPLAESPPSTLGCNLRSREWYSYVGMKVVNILIDAKALLLSLNPTIQIFENIQRQIENIRYCSAGIFADPR